MKVAHCVSTDIRVDPCGGRKEPLSVGRSTSNGREDSNLELTFNPYGEERGSGEIGEFVQDTTVRDERRFVGEGPERRNTPTLVVLSV